METISKSKPSEQPLLAISFKHKSSLVIVNSRDTGLAVNYTDGSVKESWKYAQTTKVVLSIAPHDKYLLECHENTATLRASGGEVLVQEQFLKDITASCWIDKETWAVAAGSNITLWSTGQKQCVTICETGSSDPVHSLSAKLSSKGRFSIAALSL